MAAAYVDGGHLDEEVDVEPDVVEDLDVREQCDLGEYATVFISNTKGRTKRYICNVCVSD